MCTHYDHISRDHNDELKFSLISNYLIKKLHRKQLKKSMCIESWFIFCIWVVNNFSDKESSYLKVLSLWGHWGRNVNVWVCTEQTRVRELLLPGRGWHEFIFSSPGLLRFMVKATVGLIFAFSGAPLLAFKMTAFGLCLHKLPLDLCPNLL